MDGDQVKVSPVMSVHADGNGDLPEPTSPIESPRPQPVAPPVDHGMVKLVEEVVYSDIGVNTLLVRLKQSIASARDFASFLKKRSAIEDEQSKELKKLCRITKENIGRGEARGGSYAQQFNEVMLVHERMAENGAQFALSLHQMHEDLTELSQTMENGRKHWKHTGLAAESRAQDAEKQMEKAKAKYDSLAEDYDGVKTGDKRVRGRFGIGGPKNEEDLQSRVQQADGDYAQKVQQAKNQRQELLSTHRPQAVKAIQDLITECDSALALQLQKFATFNEKLLLGNGLLITPLQDPNNPEKVQRSLRDIVHQIDNERDVQTYIRNHHSKIPSRPGEIKYEQHPTLMPAQRAPTNSQPPPQQSQPQPQQQPPPPQPVKTQTSFSSSQGPPQLPQLSMHNSNSSPPQFSQSAGANQPPPNFPREGLPPGVPQSAGPGQGGYVAYNGHQPQPPADRGYGAPQQYPGPNGPPPQQYPGPGGPPPVQQQGSFPTHGGPGSRPGTGSRGDDGMMRGAVSGRPTKPVFGVSLDDLFMRDQTPVPKIVMDCIQAVEMFGLDVEGIYRVPGTAAHIQHLRQLFDADADSVDFRNPETFSHDVNSVAGLLKQFLRELPDPLMTSENYGRFIESARMDDPTVRRDSIHAVVNELPDPNYATLRALVLHLHRVQERSASNRMSSTNLAICFAPTIMGAHRGPMADAGLQAQVVDTVLLNTLQIFDED